MPTKEEEKEIQEKSETTTKVDSAAEKSVSSRLSNNPELSSELQDILQDKEAESDSKDQSDAVADAKGAEESKEEGSDAKSDDGADTIEADISKLVEEETKIPEQKKDDENKPERSEKNMQAEIQRKFDEYKEKFEKQWKDEHGLNEPPPKADPEAVREMLKTRYPELYNSLGEGVIQDLFNFNQHQYDEVVKPNWEKSQFDKSNKEKIENDARKAIEGKPYYKQLKPIIDVLEQKNPVVKQLSGADKYDYLYNTAFSMLAPKLIQKKIQGLQKQVTEKHTVVPPDVVAVQKSQVDKKKNTLNDLDARTKHFAEKAGLTNEDLNNPLLEQGGTIIDIDRK